MPIKGLSDIRRLPRLGKIHLGVKVQGERSQYPKAVDYFVVAFDESTPQSAVDAFKKVYGDKPKELNIMFPSENPEAFFQQWYKRYGSGTGLLCKGDGETASEVQTNGEMQDKVCPCVYLNGDTEKKIKKSCRQVANLQFILPDVDGVGIWQIDTGSYNSIVNINSTIDMVKSLCKKISGIPMKLILQGQQVTVNGVKKTVHILNLKLNENLYALLKQGKSPDDKVALPTADDRPTDIVPEETAEGEFVEQGEPPAIGQGATPPAQSQAKPASPAVETQTPKPPANDDISLDDLAGAPSVPTCKKCGKPMTTKDGVINKINPKTNKPYGYVKNALVCLDCKLLVIPENV